jgi:hypothetical protein
MLDIPHPNQKLTPSIHIEKSQENDYLTQILNTRDKLINARKKEITFSKPFLSQNGNPVFQMNTINLIQGKAGVFKSHLAERMCSAILLKADPTEEMLGFHADPSLEYTICYVDTERNHCDQLPFMMQQIQKKAGIPIEITPENFDCISLLEISRANRFEALKQYIEHVRTKYSTHIVIILDVITDCIENFNDTKESMKLIDMMNLYINQFNVTFICLIHENPGSAEKARGHLGTELMNKASTVIQIGFERDGQNKPLELIKISYLKCRTSRKHDPFYAEYSEIKRGLVLASQEVIKSNLAKKRLKANTEAILDCLPDLLRLPMNKTDLFEYLMQELDCKEGILTTRLKEIIDQEVTLENIKGEVCHLKKKSVDRKAIFYLEPINSTFDSFTDKDASK